MSTNQNTKEEEVDLSSLFVVIGKGLSKFFRFIKNIFSNLFHALIVALLFVRKHFVKLAIAAVVGGALGAFLEVKNPDVFASDLILQPNFKSSRQLYNNIFFYNDLVKQKDTTSLAKIFRITKAEAGSLKKFKVFPIKAETDVLKSYNELILSVDTLASKDYSFEQYALTHTDFDYYNHNVYVEATDSKIFSKLDDIIVSAITENEYFKNVKKLTNLNLERSDALLKKDLVQVDSLRKVYMDVMIEESKKTSEGTNIDLGGVKKTTKELQLFDENRRINNELSEVLVQKTEQSEVVNVISEFQSSGYELKGVSKNYIFLLAFLSVILVILALLMKELDVYLKNYKR